MDTNQLTVLRTLLAGRVAHARRAGARGERGASAVEWVVITALLIGIAVAVGAIVLDKLTSKANSLNP
jgi:Flp pilus assembly pilin Flp